MKRAQAIVQLTEYLRDQLDRLADRATVETMQRLDDEERAAGHPPW